MFGQGCGQELFALDLLRQPLLLLLQGAKKEQKPWFPIWLPVGIVGADRSLRLPQRQIVAFLALLDDAFQRAVGHVGIARPQQHQRREYPAEPAVAVLERMDRKEHYREDGDDEERMKPFLLQRLREPGDELRHALRRVDWSRGLKDDADLLAVLIERNDAVRGGLVAAAVPHILLAVGEEVAMQLFDMVLGDSDVFQRPEHKLHRLRISGDLLLVAGGEGFDLQVRQQALDLAIRKLAALNPGGGADALDRGDAAQRRQALGSEHPQRPPGALEFIDLCNQRQDFRGDTEGVDLDGHTRRYTQLHPNSKSSPRSNQLAVSVSALTHRSSLRSRRCPLPQGERSV